MTQVLWNQDFASKSFDFNILQTEPNFFTAQVLCFEDFAKNAINKIVAFNSEIIAEARAN